MIVSLTRHQENRYINWLELHHVESLKQITVTMNSEETDATGSTKDLEELSLQLQLNFSIMESLKEIENPNADKFQTLVKDFKNIEANGRRRSNW